MPVSSRRTTPWPYQPSSAHGQYSAVPYSSSGPAPPYSAGAHQSRYGPSGPAYYPHGDLSDATASYNGYPYAIQPIEAPPALPFFEAALARARAPTAAPPLRSNTHSTPSYLPPSDPNHPDIAVGFTRNVTIRSQANQLHAASRSPSPVNELAGTWVQPREHDVERALLSEEEYRSPYLPLDEKEIDLALPPFEGPASPPRLLSALPSLYRKVGHAELGDLDPRDGDLAEGVMQHFGPAPSGRIGRRTHNADGHRRIKHTATLDDNGFFAVDMPIPTRLAQFLPFKGVEEQKTTRYTAVTIDPDDFPTSGLRLRQNVCIPSRQTEMFIVITMYNEDAELFCRTLYGVMKNIAHLCGRKNSRVWGKDGWQKVVVCIVADGRKVVNPRVLDCLAALGVYQEGAMTNMVKDRPVTAHVFEYTTSFALDGDLHFKYPDKGIVPCQIIFCMKEKNAKKINSHRWFFNAFAPLLSPNVCILLDVGTRPETKSLYHLWKAFDLNSKVGGACGEIATFKGKTWRGLLNPLVAAQCFEYKMSNILDKPMESLFGYCTVLPGAFSAYRWIALQNNADGKGPLASYFQGEELNSGKADSFTGNMVGALGCYLAEDRILCFEIVAKSKANWILKFVKSAVGETDCPDTIPEFIAQRRRWLNGSFFAAVYSLIHVSQIWRSDHSFLRKVALMIESMYNAINLIFTWFAMANFYIFFIILTSSIESPVFNIPNIKVLNTFAQYGYLGALVACFIFGMGNRPQGAPWKYKGTIYFFALLTTYMLVCAVLCAVQAIKNFDSPIFVQMIISLISTYGVFIASSLLALDPWHLVTCFAQYILFSPTYINVLNVYAYSNLHDLSWGTKGSDAVQAVDLGAIQGVGKHVEVELVSSQQDIDIVYQDALDNIRLKRAKVDDDDKPTAGVSEQQQKDIYANFRTNLLLLWSLSNAALASAILSGRDASSTFEAGAQTRTAVYMLIVLIFVAGMAMFRFIYTSCGDVVLSLIKAGKSSYSTALSTARVLHRLANEHINTVPYQSVQPKWLRLYAEAAVLEVLAEILTTKMSPGLCLDSIRRLDMAIIVAGGSHQLPRIYNLITLLQQQIPTVPRKASLSVEVPKINAILLFAPRSVEDVVEPSLEAFLTRQSSAPFVIRRYASGEASAPRWRALDRWKSGTYLQYVAGPGRVVPVELGRAYDEEGWTQAIVPFDDFLQRAGFFDGTSEAVYLAQYSLFRQMPSFESDIAIPDYAWTQPDTLHPDYHPPLEPQLNVWVGSGSSRIISPPHTDPFFNCYVQVVGQKRVWLAPPHVTPGMEAYSAASMEGSVAAKEYMGNTSRVPIFKSDAADVWATHTDFKEIVYPHSLETVLNPGDMLYMPPGWWHAMRGEGGGPAWSVSTWF